MELWIAVGVAAWLLLSVLTALVLGRVLASREAQRPKDPDPVSDLGGECSFAQVRGDQQAGTSTERVSVE